MATETLEQKSEKEEASVIPSVVLFYKSFFPSEEEENERKRAIEILHDAGFSVTSIPVNKIDSFHYASIQAEFPGRARFTGLNSIVKGAREYRHISDLIKTLPYQDLTKIRELIRQQQHNPQI